MNLDSFSPDYKTASGRFLMTMNLFEITDRLRDCHKQSITFYDEGRVATKSYSEVYKDVKATVKKLQNWGVKEGMRVGILATNCYEWVLHDIALLELRCTLVAFPEEFGSGFAAELADKYGLSLLLISKRDNWRDIAAAGWVAYLDAENPPGIKVREAVQQPIDGEFVPALIFSSGTSGKIKCLITSKRGIESTIDSFVTHFDIDGNDSFLVFLPLSHNQQRAIVYAGLFHGFDLLLVNPSQVFSALKDMRPTLFVAPPLFYETIHNRFNEAVAKLGLIKSFIFRASNALAEHIPGIYIKQKLLQESYGRIYSDLGGRIRIMWTGMAPIKRSTLTFFSRLNLPLCEAYGLTECSIITSNSPGDNRPGSVGRPLVKGSVYLAEDGEVIVHQDHLITRGYFECDGEDPLLTYLTPNTVATGDIGRFDEDGYLYLVGRKKEIIITSQGYKLHPEVIESQINVCAHVDRSVVFGTGFPYIAALISIRAAHTPAIESAIRKHIEKINAGLPTESRIARFFVTTVEFTRDNGFLTRNLKLDRRALLNHFKPHLFAQTFTKRPDRSAGDVILAGEAPQAETERKLASIWREVLNLQKVCSNDNFIDLGGQSILAAQVIGRIREDFQIELPLRTILESPTLEALATIINKACETKQAQAQAPILPVAREKDFPLSYAQQRLWFLDRLEPDSPTYNIPGAIRVSGSLDVALIEKSLNEIVRRHEALRTSFNEVHGRPCQVVTPELELKLIVLDLSQLDVREREREAMLLAVEEARQPFDITKAPLMRTRLLRFAEDDSLLLLTLHHIISDGWSVGVFLNEFITLYEAFSSGKPSPLDELPIQYGDYAAWQRQYLSGEVLERQLSYWKQQLGWDVPTLQLPLDRPRRPVRSSRGARQPIRLPARLTRALDDLSRREGVTLFMTLAATFNVLLHRYTGQSDIIIGSPIANRNRLEVEKLIGLFLNMLALRTDLSGDPSYLELLSRVKGVTLEAFSHQDLPFERLVEELALERDVNRSLLFQVMFVLQNAPMPKLNIRGLTLSLVDIDWGTAKFDLTLNLSQGVRGISGYFEYNTDLFEPSTIERMVVHFENLLASVVENPKQRISQLTLLTGTERHQLLVAWNDTKSERGSDKCVHRLIEEQAERTPDNIAVVFEREQITYRQLNARSNQLARYLQSLGVGPEIRVGLYTEPSLETIVGLLAVLKAGGAYVPLDVAYPKDRLEMILEDGQALLLLTQQRLAINLANYRGAVIYMDGDWDSIARYSKAEISSRVLPENMAYLIYTSGSTGKPKGTMVEHRQLHNYILGIVSRLTPPVGASFAVVQPLTFDSCCTVLYPSLCTGGSAHLISRERAIDPERLGEYFQQHHIKYLKITPSHLESLQIGLHPEKVLPEDWLVFGGESSHWEMIQKIQAGAATCNILNHYGPTETTVGVLTYKVPKDKPHRLSSSVPIGRPIPNIEVYLMDYGLQPVPTKVVGELHIGGKAVARGYLNRPDLTAERFIPNPFSLEPGSRLFKTGDLARYLPDGNIEFLGRIDHQIKIRGFRVEIGEIESVLGNHPSVCNVVVVAREDARGMKQLVAYVVPHIQQQITIDELQSYMKMRLPGFMMPSAFVLLDKLPLTHNGKLDRRALPAPEQSDLQAGQTVAPPCSPIEKTLAEIWGQVLRIENVGIHNNFFELGGHSLLVTQVASRIREAFRVDMPIITLFEKPTIAALAAAVEQRILDRIEEITEEEAQQLLNESQSQASER